MIYLYLFITFFEIGLFGFGGGYGRGGAHSRVDDDERVHRYRGNKPDDTRTYRHQLRYILRLHSRETRGLRRNNGDIGKRNSNIRIGIAVADIDDTHQQDVP